MTTQQRRTGVLIIRAWKEDDGPGGLRVRITSTVDVLGSEELRTSASSVEETLRIVRSWLEGLIDDRAEVRTR